MVSCDNPSHAACSCRSCGSGGGRVTPGLLDVWQKCSSWRRPQCLHTRICWSSPQRLKCGPLPVAGVGHLCTTLGPCLRQKQATLCQLSQVDLVYFGTGGPNAYCKYMGPIWLTADCKCRQWANSDISAFYLETDKMSGKINTLIYHISSLSNENQVSPMWLIL